jgi:hypothetical protein
MRNLLCTIKESTLDFIDFLKECIGPVLIVIILALAGLVVLRACVP